MLTWQQAQTFKRRDEVLLPITFCYHDQSDGETASKQRCADNVLVKRVSGNMFCWIDSKPLPAIEADYSAIGFV